MYLVMKSEKSTELLKFQRTDHKHLNKHKWCEIIKPIVKPGKFAKVNDNGRGPDE